MNKKDIPQFEKTKGTECFKSGDLFMAIKHYSKVGA